MICLVLVGGAVMRSFEHSRSRPLYVVQRAREMKGEERAAAA